MARTKDGKEYANKDGLEKSIKKLVRNLEDIEGNRKDFFSEMTVIYRTCWWRACFPVSMFSSYNFLHVKSLRFSSFCLLSQGMEQIKQPATYFSYWLSIAYYQAKLLTVKRS